VWVIGKEIPVTRLRKMMLEELQRRNYSAITTRNYLRVVSDIQANCPAFPAQRKRSPKSYVHFRASR
jgi:hypothetical protein